MNKVKDIKNLFNKNVILKDLEFLYELAVSKNNLSCAIKIKSIQAQIMGFLNKKTKIPKLSEMNDDEIKSFLELNNMNLL